MKRDHGQLQLGLYMFYRRYDSVIYFMKSYTKYTIKMTIVYRNVTGLRMPF